MGERKLTKAQIAFLIRIQSEDSFGASRHMTSGQRRTGYSLKSLGLVMLDGAISSSMTEGGSSYNGMTFVITDAGRSALEASNG